MGKKKHEKEGESSLDKSLYRGNRILCLLTSTNDTMEES